MTRIEQDECAGFSPPVSARAYERGWKNEAQDSSNDPHFHIMAYYNGLWARYDAST